MLAPCCLCNSVCPERADTLLRSSPPSTVIGHFMTSNAQKAVDASPRHGAHATIRYHPLTRDRWVDLKRLFCPRGACGGCWCMWYRLPRAAYERGKGDLNRSRFRRRVNADAPAPGILAFVGEEPIGWCAVAPRTEYQRLRTSRVMKGPDDTEVWAILCLYVRPDHRSSGVSVGLIRTAAAYAFENGAPVVEAYPVRPRAEVPAVFASPGVLSAFLKVGFEEVGSPSASRSVVRLKSAAPRRQTP
jgi:GNAT superfamily N-acetyltransferase